MCGIVGFYQKQSRRDCTDQIGLMIDEINYRGPDDRGSLILEGLGRSVIGLGQSRLSILDLSKDGHQPMSYESLHLVYNGEVYNYKEIRAKLINVGYSFSSNSDSEVVLKAFHYWREECVHEFVGMFAFFIYDQTQGTLFGFRDRVGVKPFYYYWDKRTLCISSEIKAILRHPDVIKSINSESVRKYFDLGYIPSPNSIYHNIYKLPPGHFLFFNVTHEELKVKKYWDVNDFYLSEPLDISYKEAKYKAKEILISSLDYRMISDVPVGVFLSGGYDSAITATLLREELGYDLKTFTIGFNTGNNEAPFAAEISKIIKTEHKELICDEETALKVIPQLVQFFDEPFADSSSVPTFLLSQFARAEVTVALSADGGDEVFGGYQRYFNLDYNLNMVDKIPDFASQIIGRSLKNISSIISDKSVKRYFLNSAGKALMVPKSQRRAVLYRQMLFAEEDKVERILKSDHKPSYENSFGSDLSHLYGQNYPLFVDYRTYLPDDILVKVDRCTMAHSLEGREPLLDHRLIEFSARLPFDYKIRNGIGKLLLRDILHDYIPKEKMDRPKSGFSIPLGNWMRNGLRGLMEEHFSMTSLQLNPWLNSEYAIKLYKDFLAGADHNKTLLWKVLVFQMWYKRTELKK